MKLTDLNLELYKKTNIWVWLMLVHIWFGYAAWEAHNNHIDAAFWISGIIITLGMMIVCLLYNSQDDDNVSELKRNNKISELNEKNEKLKKERDVYRKEINIGLIDKWNEDHKDWGPKCNIMYNNEKGDESPELVYTTPDNDGDLKFVKDNYHMGAWGFGNSKYIGLRQVISSEKYEEPAPEEKPEEPVDDVVDTSPPEEEETGGE